MALSVPEGWYDATWNPTVGCSRVSPGCDRCEAMRTVAQLARMGGKPAARYTGLVAAGADGTAWTGAIRIREDLLTWPLFRRDARRIFVGSLTDLFHEDLAAETLDRVHAVIAIAHWHRFLVLTKRAGRMRAYYRDPNTPRRIAVAMEQLAAAPGADAGLVVSPGAVPGGTSHPAPKRNERTRRRWAAGLRRIVYEPSAPHLRPIGLDPWPLPNLWPGVSVEDNDRLGRIGDLVQMPAVLRWVCFEPLLGPVRPDAVPIGETYYDALVGMHYARDDRDRVLPIDGPLWPPLDWVVAGGEIGAGARAMHPEWVRQLRDLCLEVRIPFFFKQWGEWAPASADGSDERMLRVGRRAAGRVLDGRSWSGLPTPVRR